MKYIVSSCILMHPAVSSENIGIHARIQSNCQPRYNQDTGQDTVRIQSRILSRFHLESLGEGNKLDLPPHLVPPHLGCLDLVFRARTEKRSKMKSLIKRLPFGHSTGQHKQDNFSLAQTVAPSSSAGCCRTLALSRSSRSAAGTAIAGATEPVRPSKQHDDSSPQGPCAAHQRRGAAS